MQPLTLLNAGNSCHYPGKSIYLKLNYLRIYFFFNNCFILLTSNSNSTSASLFSVGAAAGAGPDEPSDVVGVETPVVGAVVVPRTYAGHRVAGTQGHGGAAVGGVTGDEARLPKYLAILLAA